MEQNVRKATNFFDGVVVHSRDSNNAAVLAQPEALHQPRCVHVAIAYAHPRVGQRFRHFCRRGISQVEAHRGNTLVHAAIFFNSVDGGAAVKQNTQQFQ